MRTPTLPSPPLELKPLNAFTDWVLSRIDHHENIIKVHDALDTLTMPRRVSIYLYNQYQNSLSRGYRDAYDFYTNHIMKTRGRRITDRS